MIDQDAGTRAGRLVLVETLLVLGLSLGQSAWYSILTIVNRLTVPTALGEQTSSLNNSVTPDRPWLDLLYQVSNIAFPLVAVALVVHLLNTIRRPDGGAAEAFGISRGRWARDLGWGVLIAAGIGIPELGLYLGARALGVNTEVQAANLTSHWWTLPVLILAAAMNGILEETIMIGYLFTRWRQAGWQVPLIVIVSAVIRGSYHLYQGFGGLVGNLIMGLLFGWWFVRTKRVLPLVIAHTLLDVASFVGYTLLKGHLSWL